MTIETGRSLLRELSLDGVLTPTLNRPCKLNAITADLATDLWQALEHADAAVKAILLRGEGRAFCAGRELSAPPSDTELDGVQRVAAAIVDCGKPGGGRRPRLGRRSRTRMDARRRHRGRGAQRAIQNAQRASLGVFVTGGLVAT
jgi:enoyl-CoA hydratase/isomerase-like protein